MSIRSLAGVLFVVWVAHLNFASVFSQESDVRGKEFCDVFESVIANYESWNSGDFLVSVSSNFDTVDLDASKGVLITEEVYFRFCFDLKKNRFAYSRISEKELLDFLNNEEPSRSKKSIMAGFCQNGSKSKYRQFPNDLNDLDVNFENIGDFIAKFSIPDIRGIGLNLRTDSNGFKFAKRRSAVLASGKGLISFKSSVENVELKFNVNQKENGDFDQSVFRVSLDTLLPIYQKNTVQFKEKRYGQSESFKSRAKFLWQQVDEAYVPESVVSTYAVAKDVGARREYGIMSETLKFHCFSINQEVDECRFDGSDLKSLETFLDLCDPKRAGATNLLPEEKKHSKAGGADGK